MLPSEADYNATYGGEKVDYAPVADATTDREAANEDEALSDESMLTRTCPRAFVVINPGGNAIVSHDAMWGNGSTVTPTLAVVSSGVSWTITWPATIIDPRGNSQATNLRFGIGGAQDAVAVGVAVTGPNTASVIVASTPTHPIVVVVY
jgi:hypothetical protein